MSESSIEVILKSLRLLNSKLDDHIGKSDVVHAETTRVLGEIKPILENIQAAKKVGGMIGWVLNSKLGWFILVALAGYFGISNK